jgi:sugar lactone lactonase YvrE
LIELSTNGTVMKRIEEPRTFERASTGKLAVDGAGNWYVPYGYQSEVRILTPTGEVRDRIGRRGDGPGEFSTTFLSALAIDTRGVLYTLCGGEISRFEADGRFLDEVPTSDVGHPIDLAFAPDGSLWILTGNQRVARLALVK